MAKRKLRCIVVDDREYLWSVKPIDANYILVRLWRVGEGKQVLANVRIRFDDPWVHYGELITARTEEAQAAVAKHFVLEPLRPKDVSVLIRQLELLAPNVGHFEWSRSGGLVAVADATCPGQAVRWEVIDPEFTRD
ncbi:MAG: hypothetical protein RBU37_16830 [Myxococcota bacterium]|jgi:hypothetical protein|nr:hypothetical protein [Myxococcota bacterium]